MNNESSEAAGNPEMNKMPSKSDKKTNVKVNQPPGGASSSKGEMRARSREDCTEFFFYVYTLRM